MMSEHTLEHWPAELYQPRPDDRSHQLGPVERGGQEGFSRARGGGHRRAPRRLRRRPSRAEAPRGNPRALREDGDGAGRRASAVLRRRIMVDYAVMNQLLFEGKHKEVKALTEEALAVGTSRRRSARGWAHRRHARRRRGLQAQPHLRPRSASRRPRHEGGHGDPAPASHRPQGRRALRDGRHGHGEG